MDRKRNLLDLGTDVAIFATGAWTYGYASSGLLAPSPLLAAWDLLEVSWFPILFVSLAGFAAMRIAYYVPSFRQRVNWGSFTWPELAAILLASGAVVRLIALFTGSSREFGSFYLERGYGYYGLEDMLHLGPIPNPYQVPLILLLGTIPFLFGGALAVWMVSPLRVSWLGPLAKPPDYREHLSQVLRSEVFINAIQSELPRDDRDKETGLVGLKWLLASILERQSQSRLSAATFLRITVLLGALLLSMLLWMGYVLIDDDATGTGRRVASLHAVARDLRSSLAQIEEIEVQGSRRIERLNVLFRDLVNYLEKSPLKPSDRQAALSNATAAKNALSAGDTQSLADGLTNVVRDPSVSAWPHLKDLEREQNEIVSSHARFDVVVNKLVSDVPDFSRQLDDLRQKISASESRVPDLIKRIAVGLLVVSFMVAVLRYSTKLYQYHLDQVMAASREEVVTRRFYVAIKEAGAEANLRGTVLTDFMRGATGSEGKSTTDKHSDGPSLPMEDMLKLLLKEARNRGAGG